MRRLLHVLSARDPLSFVVATVILALAGLAATYIPVHSASRIEPDFAIRPAVR